MKQENETHIWVWVALVLILIMIGINQHNITLLDERVTNIEMAK